MVSFETPLYFNAMNLLKMALIGDRIDLSKEIAQGIDLSDYVLDDIEEAITGGPPEITNVVSKALHLAHEEHNLMKYIKFDSNAITFDSFNSGKLDDSCFCVQVPCQFNEKKFLKEYANDSKKEASR